MILKYEEPNFGVSTPAALGPPAGTLGPLQV
jgi:hypothetical protein